jgi:Uma2 family endonuclease
MGVKTLMTVPEFERLPDDDLRHELDHGALLSMPLASDEHGSVSAGIVVLLGCFVKEHSLGRVYTADTGFVLSPDTVCAPDVAFVHRERVAVRRSFFRGAPDLAVEVYSPSESIPQLMRKVRQYLNAGRHTVWVVHPEEKQVHVMTRSGEDRIVSSGEVLESPDLLPGFSVAIDSLFE